MVLEAYQLVVHVFRVTKNREHISARGTTSVDFVIARTVTFSALQVEENVFTLSNVEVLVCWTIVARHRDAVSIARCAYRFTGEIWSGHNDQCTRATTLCVLEATVVVVVDRPQAASGSNRHCRKTSRDVVEEVVDAELRQCPRRGCVGGGGSGN